jgi:plasmid stabilization system protein ParE
MKRRLVLRTAAAREFDDSIAWYESQCPGLGKTFRAFIEDYFLRIFETPELYPKIRGEVRRAVVSRRFPFVIHFLIEPERIVILSVYHAARNPDKLHHRLR